MKVIKDISLQKTKIDNIITPISDDNAICVKHRDDDYTKAFNLTNINEGLTKENEQYFYFEHSIVDTPHSVSKYGPKTFAYKVYPITNKLAQQIINGDSISKWEIYFNAFVNYQSIYTIVKNYDLHTYKEIAIIDNDTLIIPYGISPSDMKDNQTIQEFLDWNNSKFRPYRSKEEKLKTNKDILRQIKLEELNIQ
jgi:hypothetical protein